MTTKYGIKPEQNVIKFAVNNLAKFGKSVPGQCMNSSEMYSQ
jgi:hypothetical protein